MFKVLTERHYEIHNPPMCTKMVKIKMSNHTLKLLQRHDVIYDGKEIRKLPIILSNEIFVTKSSSIWMLGIFKRKYSFRKF